MGVPLGLQERHLVHRKVIQNPVLVISPHTDDAELGCGGTIARLIEDGGNVQIVAFSAGHEPERLAAEYLRAGAIMRTPTRLYNIPVRHFGEARQTILDHLVCLRETLCPGTVFVPSAADLHQDHRVVHDEALRAFKQVTMWGYELPWNHVRFSAQGFVKLKPRHVARKQEALSCYESQQDRAYFSPSFTESLARVRGLQVGEEFAEAFEVIRSVV
ncbi:hypothetical protein LCGC14_1915710 [marine sediment metagenome]|uniref:LmbE family protein n=1 Tax=marine sediment metagenome TaxID=412755 RepID=A0A0F9FS61_9ZZZZ